MAAIAAIPIDRQAAGSMAGQAIDGGNLHFVRLMGVGTYGEVYHTVDRSSGESYAVKVLPRALTPLPSSTCMDNPVVDGRSLSHEVALFAAVPPHENIIRLVRMMHTQDQLFVVMEYCSGGDLYENVSKNPHFRLPGNDPLICRLFLQLVSAVQHCHSHGVYHRDIKPENVLVTRDGLNVKLIDFGLATNKPWCREIGCGSAHYMSPECQGGINGDVVQYAAAPNDVWALGIIMINLASGRNPWTRAHITDPLFQRYLVDKTILCRAISASPEFEHVICRTLDVNPATRCTLTELRQLIEACSHFVSNKDAPRRTAGKESSIRPPLPPQPSVPAAAKLVVQHDRPVFDIVTRPQRADMCFSQANRTQLPAVVGHGSPANNDECAVAQAEDRMSASSAGSMPESLSATAKHFGYMPIAIPPATKQMTTAAALCASRKSTDMFSLDSGFVGSGPLACTVAGHEC
ncbi:Serine/threonine protein kinase [Coemansia sp. BCRC 34301]|nr:Serine/threonine protein kinase [Coemansia sp. BCRC 34301]